MPFPHLRSEICLKCRQKILINFIRNFNLSVQIMVIANQRKYEQNPELRRELFTTADTELVEASPTDTRYL